MAGIQPIHERIWEASYELPSGAALNVHLVVGDRYAVWIDSGVQAMFPLLRQTMQRAEVPPSALRFILHTHPHNDHIGCDAQLREYTNCLIAAHRRHAAWHHDFERHYQEFARSFPHIIPDTPDLRAAVLGPMDGEHPVDLLIDNELSIDLGGIRLEAYSFSGHFPEELAWFDPVSRTFLFGDVLTLREGPFLHGHLSVGEYRKSLERIAGLVEELDVQQALFAHYPPKSRDQLLAMLEATGAYLDRLDTIVINLVTGHERISLEALWREVVQTLQVRADFRSLDTVHAHLEHLIERGKLEAVESEVYGPVE